MAANKHNNSMLCLKNKKKKTKKKTKKKHCICLFINLIYVLFDTRETLLGQTLYIDSYDIRLLNGLATIQNKSF